MNFYAPQDPKFLKKEREKARELKKTSWWNQKLQAGVCYYCEGKFPKDQLTIQKQYRMLL
jgi:5-methylcytosine-specific restriction protein A